MSDAILLQHAHAARQKAYAPYSHFAVGAALKTASGNIYLGANIENGAYSPSCCAERVALYQALMADETDFTAIAIVGGPQGQPPTAPTPPCGVCRQVLAEFCPPTLRILLSSAEHTLGDLLPQAFRLEE